VEVGYTAIVSASPQATIAQEMLARFTEWRQDTTILQNKPFKSV
jgi:hypothetical protein